VVIEAVEAAEEVIEAAEAVEAVTEAAEEEEVKASTAANLRKTSMRSMPQSNSIWWI
jgi:hypothetical protein